MVRPSVSIRKLIKLNRNGKVYKNYPLSRLTTLKIGGVAQVFLEINTLENFAQIMSYLEKTKIDICVIGCGSKILASSHGYRGVIIKLGGDLARIESRDDFLELGAGVTLAQVYKYACIRGLSGFEESVGIPATIGGAVYMNASAYGFEMAQLVEYVIVYHKGRIEYLDRESCQFGYRDSIFQRGHYIILRVGVRLGYLDTNKIERKMRETLSKRQQSQPLGYLSAGSIFRRMDGLNIGKMLEDLGLKGYKLGGAQISDKHANFIINLQSATSQDIFDLIKLYKQRFWETYQIKLKEEIIYLGDFDETNR